MGEEKEREERKEEFAIVPPPSQPWREIDASGQSSVPGSASQHGDSMLSQSGTLSGRVSSFIALMWMVLSGV